LTNPEYTIGINPLKVLRLLWAVIAMLVLASITGQVIKYVTGHDYVYGFVTKFNVDDELTVPTYFSAVMSLTSSVLLAVIARLTIARRGPYASHWFGLSVLFLYLAFDEACRIHEMAIIPMQKLFGASGYFYFAWVIPAWVIIAALGILYFGFFRKLPKRIRRLFLTAAALCICGGIGFEMISGHYVQRHNDQEPVYITMITIEELLEMTGVSLFIYALLEYIKQTTPNVTFRIGPGGPAKTGNETIRNDPSPGNAHTV